MPSPGSRSAVGLTAGFGGSAGAVRPAGLTADAPVVDSVGAAGFAVDVVTVPLRGADRLPRGLVPEAVITGVVGAGPPVATAVARGASVTAVAGAAAEAVARPGPLAAGGFIRAGSSGRRSARLFGFGFSFRVVGGFGGGSFRGNALGTAVPFGLGAGGTLRAGAACGGSG